MSGSANYMYLKNSAFVFNGPKWETINFLSWGDKFMNGEFFIPVESLNFNSTNDELQKLSINYTIFENPTVITHKKGHIVVRFLEED